MDNRIFNVNGRLDRDGEKLLESAIDLAMRIAGDLKVVAWRVSKESGLILDRHASTKGCTKLPAAMGSKQVMSLVLPWLQSEEAKQTQLDSWDRDYDHDGHNGPGWRVYCGDWGHVEGHGAIVAVKPAFMWYGK